MKILGSQILQKAVLRPRSLRMTHPPHPLILSKLVIKTHTCVPRTKQCAAAIALTRGCVLWCGRVSCLEAPCEIFARTNVPELLA